MATTVLPLQPSPNDARAMAELDRAMLHIHGDDWAEFAALIQGALASTPAQLHHLLVLVDERDDSHLVEPLAWRDGELVPAVTVPTVACRWPAHHV